MPADGLAVEPQEDFSAGAFQGVARHLIPGKGVYEAKNGLLDDNGSIYKRGGSAYLSTAGFGSAGRLPMFLFDGYLSAGQRTVFADNNAFGVLDAGDGPLSLGGGGLSEPRRGVVIGGVLVIGGGKLYAGSLKTANYAAGTIATTIGSAVITGTGTTWLANVDAGMLLQVAAERFYVVKSVDSNTQITLTEAYEAATGAGKAYTLTPLATLPAALQSDVYAAAGDRLVIVNGSTITFSNGRSPGNAGDPPAGQLRWQTFTSTDRWAIPDGVQALGAAALRDNLLVFTTGGVYALTNLAYDLTDVAGNLQQSLQRINPDLILWGNAGIASWGNALVVPATDGVWLIDGSSAPQSITTSIVGRYRSYVSAAAQPGVATMYRGEYLLPVLSAASGWLDLLVCRVDRPVRTSVGVVFPWTWLDGAGARVGALAVRRSLSSRPLLIGGGIGVLAGGAPSGIALTWVPGSGSWNTLQDVYYKVTAIVGAETGPSVEVGHHYVHGLPVTGAAWRVSWDAFPGATGYRIYRGTASGAQDRYFTVGAVTSFLDTSPTAPGTAGTPPVGSSPGSRILDLSGFFEPAAGNKTDHDTTVPEWSVTTRDVTPDRLNVEALVKQLRSRYELVDAASDDPTISAWYSIGIAQGGQALWDEAVWDEAQWGAGDESAEVQMPGQAPESDGRVPFVWPVGQRTRFIRFRLRCADPVARLVLRTLELKTRPSGRQ